MNQHWGGAAREGAPFPQLSQAGKGRAGRLGGFPLMQPQGAWGEDGGKEGWLAGRCRFTGPTPSNKKPKKTQVKHLRTLFLSLKPHTQHPGPSCWEGLQQFKQHRLTSSAGEGRGGQHWPLGCTSPHPQCHPGFQVGCMVRGSIHKWSSWLGFGP